MKPVAWIDDLQTILSHEEYRRLDDDEKEGLIPLYTAPKELTDEEIIKEWDWKYEGTHKNALIDFAKAILKKASEK